MFIYINVFLSDYAEKQVRRENISFTPTSAAITTPTSPHQMTPHPPHQTTPHTPHQTARVAVTGVAPVVDSGPDTLNHSLIAGLAVSLLLVIGELHSIILFIYLKLTILLLIKIHRLAKLILSHVWIIT